MYAVARSAIYPENSNSGIQADRESAISLNQGHLGAKKAH